MLGSPLRNLFLLVVVAVDAVVVAAGCACARVALGRIKQVPYNTGDCEWARLLVSRCTEQWEGWGAHVRLSRAAPQPVGRWV